MLCIKVREHLLYRFNHLSPFLHPQLRPSLQKFVRQKLLHFDSYKIPETIALGTTRPVYLQSEACLCQNNCIYDVKKKNKKKHIYRCFSSLIRKAQLPSQLESFEGNGMKSTLIFPKLRYNRTWNISTCLG